MLCMPCCWHQCRCSCICGACCSIGIESVSAETGGALSRLQAAPRQLKIQTLQSALALCKQPATAPKHPPSAPNSMGGGCKNSELAARADSQSPSVGAG